MDYFSQGPTAGPSNSKHVHSDEVDSATPPSSPSEQGEVLSVTHARRHTPTAATFATLLNRGSNTRFHEDIPPNPPPPQDHRHHQRHSSRNNDASRGNRSQPSSSQSSAHYQQPPNSYPHSFGTSSSTSARSKAKLKKLNSLLLLASTRLNEESTRARTAEERLTSALSLLTRTRTEQTQVNTQVSALSTQLELYKNQLSVAQEEILRAQRVVEDVEKGRREAEESAARARARARRLEEERVVRMAIEQGRREGYRQGLERGRQMALAQLGRRRVYDEEDDDEFEEEEEDIDVDMDTKSERSARTERTDGSVGTSRRPGSTNVARYPPPLPIPTLITPPPLRVPSTQPQPSGRPPSAGPSVHSSYKRAPSNSRPVPAPSKSPESIQPLDPRSARGTPVSSIGVGSQQVRPPIPPFPSVSPPTTQQQQPILHPPPLLPQQQQQQQQQQQPPPTPIRTIASPVAHRPITIPPDGFIPVLGSDSMITLPPPHELSQTPRTFTMSVKDGEEDGGEGDKDGGGDKGELSRNTSANAATSSRYPERIGRAPSGDNRSVASSTRRMRVVNGAVRDPNRPIYRIPRSATSVSSASLSQFDILSPPDTADQDRFPGNISGSGRGDDGADQASMRAEYERRRVEYERRTPQTPTPVGRRPPTTMIYAESAPSAGRGSERRLARRTPSQEIEDEWRSANVPATGDGGDKGKGRAHASPATNPELRVDPRTMSPRGPRRPKRIVMPQPLSLGTAAGMMQNAPSQPSQSDGYPPPPIYQPPPSDVQPPPAPQQQQPSQSHQDSVPFPRQSPEDVHRKTPLQWFKQRFNSRTPSSGTVPQISVEPPSQSPSGHSQDDELNPVLLTPEDAHRTTPLPGDVDPHGGVNAQIHRTDTPTHTRGRTPVTIVLPDNQLPIGFVPMNTTPSSGANALPAALGAPPKYKIYDDVGPPRPSTSGSHRSVGGNPVGSPSSGSGSSGSGKTKINGHGGQAFSPAPLARPLSLFSDVS